MSFVSVPRQNFETFQADGPWESGAPGWSSAPVPGWGMNPNQSLPRMQATAGCGCSGAVGEEAAVPPTATKLPIWPVFVLLGIMGAGMYGTYWIATRSDRRRR